MGSVRKELAVNAKAEDVWEPVGPARAARNQAPPADPPVRRAPSVTPVLAPQAGVCSGPLAHAG
jgi:hypothetical protein